MRRHRYLIYTYKDAMTRVYLTQESDATDFRTFSTHRHEAHLFEFRKEFEHLLDIGGLYHEKIDISGSAPIKG